MAIKRLIGSILVRRGVAVQSFGFERYLPLGRPEIAARFFDEWGVDEILLLDIEAFSDGRVIDTDLARRVSEAGYVPVTAGGGIRNVEDIRALLEAGIDKICVNQLATQNLAMVEEASRHFGAQCIVGSIDVRRSDDGAYHVFTDSGGHDCRVDPLTHARRLVDAGVGEILLTSIERDGSGRGYDLDLVEAVAPWLEVPVIVSGGAGHPRHLLDALAMESVSAVAAGNMLHHTEHAIPLLKSWLRNADADVRGEYHALYRHLPFDEDGRLAKLPDAELLEQMFETVEVEPI